MTPIDPFAPAPIYTLAGIRAIEQRCLPGAVPSLMERAGLAAAEVALSLLQDRQGPVLVACGPGNNGGDGFVLARHLAHAGRQVVVAFAGDPDKLPADAHEALGELHDGGLQTVPKLPRGEWALAVDALFGIGLQRPVEGRYAEWIAALNALPCPRLAIDVPSGLEADTGRLLGTAVRADHTITFIALKPGLLTLEGPDLCGEIAVHDLGLAPSDLLPPAGRSVAPAGFAAQLKPRPRDSHKGMNGSVGIIGGAPGMVGAALLAGRAALRLGAGRIYVGLLAPDAPRVDLLQPELMLRPAGEVASLATAVAVGPGLGQSPEAQELLRRAVASDLPLVLDADALNLLAAHPVLAGQVRRRDAPTLLTPHPAEAARLLGFDTAAVQADRVKSALELAQRFAAPVVLKGAGSVIAAPDGAWRINPTGNPGMASAGMGDVLTGIACALLAQGWPAFEALQGAVWLHGAAADECVAKGIGPIGLAAGDTIDAARAVLNRLVHSGTQPGR